jgi:uncharacterized protein with HEPN domain
MLAKVHDYRAMISFRNLLVHGYDALDVRIVWAIIEDDLEPLIADLSRLLG